MPCKTLSRRHMFAPNTQPNRQAIAVCSLSHNIAVTQYRRKQWETPQPISAPSFLHSSSPRFGERNRRLTITQSRASGARWGSDGQKVRQSRNASRAFASGGVDNGERKCCFSLSRDIHTSYNNILSFHRRYCPRFVVPLHFWLIALAIRHIHTLTLQPPA